MRVTEAAAFIARDRPAAAELWVIGLFARTADLTALPEQGWIVPELGRPTVREIQYAGYRVIYRCDPHRILVLTIRHARRQFDFAELTDPSSQSERDA